MPWASRVQSLSQLETFGLKGNLEVHAHGHKGAYLTFQWQQTPHDYKFQLLNSAGRVYLELIATKQSAKLYTKGKTYSAKRAESLIQQHLGVNLPISYFPSWLKGLPAMGYRHERILTPTHHLLKLHQAGWFLRYLRYHKIRSTDLPSQILMTKGDWHARLLVTHWKI
jgi:outer membrane lipoprotein LolB